MFSANFLHYYLVNLCLFVVLNFVESMHPAPRFVMASILMDRYFFLWLAAPQNLTKKNCVWLSGVYWWWKIPTEKILLRIHIILYNSSFRFLFYRPAATGPAYPTAQTGYAVAPATTAATYGAQRTGYDQAYQAAANQGQYASKCHLRYYFVNSFLVVL